MERAHGWLFVPRASASANITPILNKHPLNLIVESVIHHPKCVIGERIYRLLRNDVASIYTLIKIMDSYSFRGFLHKRPKVGVCAAIPGEEGNVEVNCPIGESP